MRGFSVTLDPELKAEVVEDVGEGAAEHGGFLVIPGKHLCVVDVRKKQRPPRLREGRRSAIENEKGLCIIVRDSEEPEGKDHAPHEHAVDNVECPIPPHGHRTKTGKYKGVRAHINEVHTGIVSLRDTNFAGSKDTFEPKPGAEPQPSELVKRVDPIEGNEAPAKWPIGVTVLSSFKQRAAEANRR